MRQEALQLHTQPASPLSACAQIVWLKKVQSRLSYHSRCTSMLPWLTPASVRPFMPLRDGSRMRQGADICSISSSFVRGLSQARTLRLGPLRQALQRY